MEIVIRLLYRRMDMEQPKPDPIQAAFDFKHEPDRPAILKIAANGGME